MGHGHGHHENIGMDWDSIEMDMLKLKIWIVVCIASQICLTLWKKWRAKSYHVATFIAMWIIPLGYSIAIGDRMFFCRWLVFSFLTSLLTKRFLEEPRHFYKAFLLIHKICYLFFIFGFSTTMATFLGLNLIFGVRPGTWIDLGHPCFFCALYYG